MKDLRLGIDIDGVLADFNQAYRRKLIQASGRDLIPEGEEPPVWNYAPHYGYTVQEDEKAWQLIKEDKTFWQYLQPLPGAPTFIEWLWRLQQDNWSFGHSHEVYFLTNRPGIHAKRQSENWLATHGMGAVPPTVLITRGSKGQLAKSLGLTHLIDDRVENVYDVICAAPACKTYMRRARYNEEKEADVLKYGGKIVNNITEFRTILTDQQRGVHV